VSGVEATGPVFGLGGSCFGGGFDVSKSAATAGPATALEGFSALFSLPSIHPSIHPSGLAGKSSKSRFVAGKQQQRGRETDIIDQIRSQEFQRPPQTDISRRYFGSRAKS
jgi:hypothetical protein